jgi:ribosomal protein L2
MAVVKCKPTSPGRRFVVKIVNKELHDWSTIVGYLKKMYEAFEVIGIQDTSEEVKTKYLNIYNR